MDGPVDGRTLCYVYGGGGNWPTNNFVPNFGCFCYNSMIKTLDHQAASRGIMQELIPVLI